MSATTTGAATSTLYQIGEVAERVGLSLRTVRYYEEMGLVVPARRTDGGFRLYGEDQVDRLLLITQVKPLGFTVSEMGDLLDARDQMRSAAAGKDVREAASARLAEFAQMADERCARLRDQLAGGERVAKQLAGESRGALSAAREH